MSRAPLVEHIGELRRHHGTQKPFVADVVLEDGGLALSSAWVPADGVVSVKVTLEAIHEGLVVTGTIAFAWVGECRRCLDRVHGEAQVSVREVFETTPVEGETWPLSVDTVDLEPMVRETVLLALPLAPLCGPGCPGPAPNEFPNEVAADEPEGAERGPDPRWAALDELTFDE